MAAGAEVAIWASDRDAGGRGARAAETHEKAGSSRRGVRAGRPRVLLVARDASRLAVPETAEVSEPDRRPKVGSARALRDLCGAR